jgi:NRAMP (natural resistance-associated macrophage protein)-like metal ion transporter
MKKLKRSFWSRIGPGFITGAADDDPSGIATYAQAGAQFGTGLLWLTIWLIPLMTSVQEACARIGAVTGRGLASAIQMRYGKSVMLILVALLWLANTINIGANIGAMAEAVRLLVPIPFIVGAVGFTVIAVISQVFIPYRQYVNLLKWLTFFLLAYPLSLLISGADLREGIKAITQPAFMWNAEFLLLMTGVIGTTIAPYMFFWQTSQEIEEEVEKGMTKEVGIKPKHVVHGFLASIRFDTALGMCASQITAWSIVFLSGFVLFRAGAGDGIINAADAARALEPLVAAFPNSGLLAKLLFAIGIIGLGMLSIPVLAGSAAYALSDVFHFKEGLSLSFKKARGFYTIIILATVVGLGMNLMGIDPFKALIYTAVINAVVAVPVLWCIFQVSRSQKIMGKYSSGPASQIGLLTAFVLLLISSLLMGISMVFP